MIADGGLRELVPGLSAIVATVTVQLEATVPADRLRERLTATVAVERVAELTTTGPNPRLRPTELPLERSAIQQ